MTRISQRQHHAFGSALTDLAFLSQNWSKMRLTLMTDKEIIDGRKTLKEMKNVMPVLECLEQDKTVHLGNE
jgi:hypothetical protein